MKNNDCIILLSGGLDCTVALAQTYKDFENILAITFDYGQKSLQKELIASKAICDFYKIEQKIIRLDWLKEITQNSENLWIPNRNSVFINIAASFLDAQNGGKIIIGANKEEAQTFSDNSLDFITQINKTLKYSCEKDTEVIAPLINYDKSEIVKMAIELTAPLHLINSCYSSCEKHCGKCNSCKLLKTALEMNNRQDIINLIFT